MNINAQELTLLKKNMKFGEVPATNPQSTTVPEAPVAKPEASLKALDMQAQNNIAFQAVKLPTAVKQGMGKIMMLAALAGGVATSALTSSCTELYNKTEVTIDMTEINTLIAELKALYTEMLELQKINNETLKFMLAYIQDLCTKVEQAKISQEEFHQKVYEYMINDSAVQKLILEQLIKNGKSQEEANAWLQQLILDVKLDRITFEEAIKQIMEVLGSIDATLKDVLTEVKGLRDDMNSNHKELMATKKEELEYLGKFYEQGEDQKSILDSMYQKQKEMAEKINILTENSNELLSIAKDDTKYKELMNKLDSLKSDDIDYKKFEEMFKLLNMNIQKAIADFKADNRKGQQALIGAINDFKNTYIKTEDAQSKQFNTIISKLDFITKYLPNLNQDDVEAAIKELTEAINNNTESVEENTEVVGDGLSNINAKLDAVIAKLDTLIDNTSGLAEYFASQKDNWINALKNLEKGNQMLDRILTEQKITNEYLSGFKADFAEMKDAQKTANSYLNILIKKADAVEKAIQEIDVNVEVNGGMTRDEFLSAMEERDAKAAAEFKKFIKEYGFDKVPGDVQTIKEFLAQVKDAIQSQKDYSGQLDRIIAQGNNIYNFLLNMDFSNPEEIAKLDKIINILENWKHICECDHDNTSGDDENKNDESIKDLEDMFS